MERIPEKDRETFAAGGTAEREWNGRGRLVPFGPSTRPAKTVSQSRNRAVTRLSPLQTAVRPFFGAGSLRTVSEERMGESPERPKAAGPEHRPEAVLVPFLALCVAGWFDD